VSPVWFADIATGQVARDVFALGYCLGKEISLAPKANDDEFVKDMPGQGIRRQRVE
jgi:hypothetical protein